MFLFSEGINKYTIVSNILLMVSAKRSAKKKRSHSSQSSVTNLRSLRAMLNQKNNTTVAPAKHHMCRKLFVAYLEQKHPNKHVPRGLYPTARRVLSDVIFAGCMDWY